MIADRPPLPDRAALERARDVEVDDLVVPEMRLLFVGINPSLWTAAVGAHFARPGNRFWPAVHRAGITRRLIDPRAGMSAVDLDEVGRARFGITNLVRRATARAEELTADELRAAGPALAERVERWRPAVVAVLGLTAYRQAFGVRSARAGRQDTVLAGAALWVLPNPSGLNAHETVDSLAAAYRAAAGEAGIVV